ncbi:MAG TPA: PAS domain S-box protein, partial [Cryomorphaceae bacterium]|nr:PAS domain S-box protein [Cryomorphaceae bacterium]
MKSSEERRTKSFKSKHDENEIHATTEKDGDVKPIAKAEVSESYLINIMNHIGDPVFVKDEHSRLLNVNDAFCELFGLSRDQIIGKTLAEDVSPEERDSFLKIDREVLAKGVENINEESLTVRNGQTRRISTRKSRFVDAEGNKFIVGVIHDITERSIAERELKAAKEHAEEYKERFRILMLNMEAGVVIHAPDTSIVQNNKRASEILGLSDDQLRGKTAIDPDWKFVDLDKNPLPPEEYPVNRIARTKAPIKIELAGIYQPDKEDILWLTVNGFPVLNHRGDLIEIVTVFVDITEQKKQEEDNLAGKLQLEKSEKELKKAQKLAKVGSWILNLVDDELSWSEEMFHIWGFDPKKGTPAYDPDIMSRVHPDDLEIFTSFFNHPINLTTPYDIEFRVCIPNMEQKVVRSIFEPLTGEDGEVAFLSGTNQDITHQKIFEEAQIKHQRLKAIGEMSSSIAHDFNNALQEMMGNLEVVKLQDGLSDKTIGRLNNIASIISDTASRVSALQKFGDTKNEEKDSQLIDLNKQIQESLEQSRPLWKDEMEKEGFGINVSTDFQEVPNIRCNSGELKSAVYNLIKNSIEAMPEGGDLKIKTGTNQDRVIATFTDTGMGMDAEAKMKVFEPFFTTKGFNPGRGLGMSGAYSIVKKWGGDIAVKSSEKGKGTTIEIAFPISHREKETEVSTPSNTPKANQVFNVLWVDDDFIIAKSSRLMVESLGHQCIAVSNGKKALEHLENNPCDIVFTDIGMPKMNGWELAEAIRKRFGKEVRIAAVTGWNMKEKAAEENAIDFFLQKPFSLGEVNRILVEMQKVK